MGRSGLQPGHQTRPKEPYRAALSAAQGPERSRSHECLSLSTGARSARSGETPVLAAAGAFAFLVFPFP
jgi:hypothetical protein